MQIANYGPEHLEEYVPSLDFGVGEFVGARAEYEHHMPTLDPEIVKASIEKLGSSDFDFAPGKTVVSQEVFDNYGCGFIEEDGERCDRPWSEHAPKFILLVRLFRECTPEELVQAWAERGVFPFVEDFEQVQFEGDHVVDMEGGADDE